VLQLSFIKFDSFQTLWTLYITMTLGILAYLSTAHRSSRSELVRLLLAFSFGAFAWVNFQALDAVRVQRSHLAEVATAMVIEKAKAIDRATRDHFLTVIQEGRPPSARGLASCHLVIDAIVIVVILILPTTLISLTPLSDGSSAKVRPKGSPLPPVSVTRIEIRRAWALTQDYRAPASDSELEFTQGYTFHVPNNFEF